MMRKLTGWVILLVSACFFQQSFCQEDAEEEMCDVMALAKCFDEMTELSPMNEVSHLPDEQIVVPCQEQRPEIETFETCLNMATVGCPTLQQDASTWIHNADAFCESVLGECNPFSDKYLDTLRCRQTFNGHILDGNVSEETCHEFEQCLLADFDTCRALAENIASIWEEFDHICDNSSLHLNDEGYLSSAATVQGTMLCPQLDELSENIEACYQTELNGPMATFGTSVTAYCESVGTFADCVNGHMDSVECDVIEEIYNASMQDFANAIEPFCIGVNPPEENICDLASIAQCLADTETSIWNVASLVQDDQGAPKSSEDIKDAVAQATALDLMGQLASTCDEAAGVTETALTCIETNMAGCVEDVVMAAQNQASFLIDFCDVMDNCTSTETFEIALQNCSLVAEAKLKDFAQDDDLIGDAFINEFCGTFHDMATCLHDLVTPCTHDSVHVNTMLANLVGDLDPVCPRAGFDDLNVTKDNNETTAFLECTDMAETSAEIGECDAAYLSALFEQPSNFTHICDAINEWQTCLETVVSPCWMLNTEMYHILQAVRDSFMDTCPPPQTATTPAESGEETSNGGSNESSDGDTSQSGSDSEEGGDSDSAAFLTTNFLAVASMSLLVHVFV